MSFRASRMFSLLLFLLVFVFDGTFCTTGGPWATRFLVLVKVRVAQNSCFSKLFDATQNRVTQVKFVLLNSNFLLWKVVLCSKCERIWRNMEIWGHLGGCLEDFGSKKFVLLKDFALCKTFWIFQKIRAAQNRVAQIRVAQGRPYLEFVKSIFHWNY